MSPTLSGLKTLAVVIPLIAAIGCDEFAHDCDEPVVLAEGGDDPPSRDSAQETQTPRELHEEPLAVVEDVAQDLMWMRCEQGMEYLSNIEWCNGKRTDFEYCSEQDNSCNGVSDEGDLTGEGVSAVFESCADLNEDGGFAGYDNWRVPTVDELTGLFDGLYDDAREEFPNTRKSWYWSSTSDTNRNALFVSYISGDIGIYSKLGRYPVRCVREL
jgi:hypothetical protein